MRFPPAHALLLLLLAGSLPLPARAVRPCVNLSGPTASLCFVDRREWQDVAEQRGGAELAVTFDTFTQNASFENNKTGAEVATGPFTLKTLGPPSCTPIKQEICGFNLVRRTIAAGMPFVTRIENPFAHVYVNHDEPESDDKPGRAGTELQLRFSPPITAWGAEFRSQFDGEGIKLVLNPDDPATRTEFLPLTSSPGFFGFATTPPVPITELRIVAVLLRPGTSGEVFGMDQVGRSPECFDGIDNDGDGGTDVRARLDASIRPRWTDLDADCTSTLDATEAPDCADGLDNDADGVSDFPDDPGCRDAADATEKSDCDDGFDNDGDGRVDAAGGDPGCADAADDAETSPDLVCDNGQDDDGDGLTDWAGADGIPDDEMDAEPDGLDDPGCAWAEDRSEAPDCSNGQDDDGDGFADFPDDPGCASPGGRSEAPECADGLDNDRDGAIDGDDPECTEAASASEEPDCDDGLDNDGDGFTDFSGRDGIASTDPGALEDSGADDDRGCDDRADLSERSIDLVCDNGVDDDGDGLTDIPADQGCETRRDDDERINGPALGGACDNGQDDDGDGSSDFGGPDADPGCASAADRSEQTLCDDGFDNDGDGRVDFPEDPGCEDELDEDENAAACAEEGDADGDVVCDLGDNCLFEFNPDQVDSNLDGIGNACDFDYDQDGFVGGGDIMRFSRALGSREGDPRYDPALDVDSDGAIGARDFAVVRSHFGERVGASLLSCGASDCASP